MRIGYTMMCEQAGPRQLVRDVVRAEQAGFDFAVISDHYNPWLDAQGHSPYAWSVLGAAAQEHSGPAASVPSTAVASEPSTAAAEARSGPAAPVGSGHAAPAGSGPAAPGPVGAPYPHHGQPAAANGDRDRPVRPAAGDAAGHNAQDHQPATRSTPAHT